MSAATTIASPRAATRALPTAAIVLRLGAALCFIGHGAFGFITKQAWLPYFAVAGIPERWAWTLMPWIGAVDVLAGMAVLFAPRALPLLYMVVWAFWTALLRPLSGESVFELFERAGNYGVPLAFLALFHITPLTWRGLVAPLTDTLDDARTLRRVGAILRWTTCLLLFGHGALGALHGKALLVAHYAALGLPSSTVAIVGWLEIGLALAVAVRPTAALLLLVGAWKLASESLFPITGDSGWEFVERAGSFAAPFALALLTARGERGD